MRAQDPAPPSEINIVVVEGEAAMNNLGQRVTREPVVRVEGDNHQPISGAAVVFTLPTDGPTGEFGNGSKTLIVTTDAQGLAAGKGLKINRVAGKLQIRVNTSYRGLAASTTITQFNMAVPGQRAGVSHGKVIAIVAAVGAAAAGAIFATTSGKNGSAAPPPTTPTNPSIVITPGTGTVGPPN